MSKKVGIVGAGIVGLSTALRLKEVAPDVDVTIISELFYNQTTSYNCGGLWEPYQIAGTPDEKINEWGKCAFDHFLGLMNSTAQSECGVQLLQVNQLFDGSQNSASPTWKDIVFNFKRLESQDIQKMGLPSKYVAGYTFGTLVIDQKYYLRYITSLLESMNVKFVQMRIENIETFCKQSYEYDVVVNCTGMGAFSCAQDEEMYPIRGQVLRVKAPWLTNVWFFGTSYIIPNLDTVVLGGTGQKGDWNTNVSLEDTTKIVDDIAAVFPGIRGAPVEAIWVGLRPGRAPLRLESEQVEAVLLVHCYGHGGSGVTIGMGCAHEVVRDHIMPYLSQCGADSCQSGGDSNCLSAWIRHRSRL